MWPHFESMSLADAAGAEDDEDEEGGDMDEQEEGIKTI